MRSRYALALLGLLLGAPSAAAGKNPALDLPVTGYAPPMGGLGAVAAHVEVATKTVRIRGCPGLPCDAKDGELIPVDLEGEVLRADTKVVAVRVGPSRSALHVRLVSAKDARVGWEAIVVAKQGGGANVLFKGRTGAGSSGEGERVVIDEVEKTVYLGKLRRELTLCGQNETLLGPRRLDPTTMTFHAVAMHRISKAARDKAPTLTGTIATSAPIGSVLGIRGASTNDGASAALIDDDPDTAWFETRKGDGKGEFVVFSAPKNTPLEKISIIVEPKKEKAPPDYAAPTWLWLVTDDATYRVSIPAVDPGQRVDVLFPSPTATTCVGIALDAASESGDVSVGLAEVEGVPVVPKTIHALEDLVTFLDGKAPEAELAIRILSNAGVRGAKALTAKLGTVGDLGKERAIDVFEAITPCSAAAPGLVRLSWDAPKKIASAARTALDACGTGAKVAIGEAFAEGPAAAREALAERFARLDPKGALLAILGIVPSSPASRRRTYRIALARVATSVEGRGAIASWLGSPAASAPVKSGESDPAIELGRSIAGSADLGPTELVPLSTVLVAHAAEGQPFEARWLAAAPLGTLAARGDAPAAAWLRALFRSTDRHLRARAAEVSGEVPALRPELVAALADGDPRVRQRALEALRRGGGAAGATAPVIALLGNDGWTYVRVAAADALGDSTGAGDIDLALARATADGARSVRSAAIRGLVARHARAQLPAIRTIAFDKDEMIDVRREAIEALGKLCDKDSADALYDLARKMSESDGMRQLGLAAIVALGDIHPPDLATRLATLDQTSLVVKDAVRRALKTESTCK